MKTITGLFDTHEQAADAVRALRDLGVRSEDISLVANNAEGYTVDDADEDEIAEGASAGAGLGAILGGAGGLLAGLGTLAIPGIGPVVAGGWLLSTVVGAAAGAAIGGAAGGLIGALVEAGISESEAHVYAEGVRRGGTLVTARIADEQASEAEAVLHTGRVDIEARRRDYEAEGWKRFDEDAPAYSPDEVDAYRASFIPPVI
jgi:hypothetical protein